MSCTLILSRTEATPECTSLRSCSKDFSIWAKRSSACERTECPGKNLYKSEDPISNYKSPTQPPGLQLPARECERQLPPFPSEHFSGLPASPIKIPPKNCDIKIPSTKSHQTDLFSTQRFNLKRLSASVSTGPSK